LGRDQERVELSYEDLKRQTNRFANLLRELGITKGERVFTLAGRVPALYVAAIGTLKNGSVYCPLFAAFGPEPIRERLQLGEGRVLVTTSRLYARKVSGLRDALPRLEHILLVDDCDTSTISGGRVLQQELDRASPEFTIAPTSPDDMALLHFTSGTTGRPKGAVHVHEAVVAHHASAKFALDLQPDDVFWCTADPGWVTGTSYGILAPLAHGVTNIVDEADFDAERWYRILQDERVTVWYTAPTAIRMLMKCGPELPRKFDLSSLRLIASVGEPLNPEAVLWGRDVLGLPIHDNWWQTETGGILVANFPGVDIRPGSMGLPLPGIGVAIAERREGEGLQIVTEAGVPGELAIRSGWPSMFRGYLNEEERYRKCFVDGWYLTGDLVERDDDGYLWFVGRADDVIKTAGHLVGPFEVESALMEHAAVAEAGVFGKPDPIAGTTVKAVVELKTGFTPSDGLRRELLAHARRRLGPAIAPREIDFADVLPKTRSGKIMRRVLRARELGLPEGDLSALDSPEASP
jgi:acetyl-CoA synthetase